jgi:protein-disulfide isomerase
VEQQSVNRRNMKPFAVILTAVALVGIVALLYVTTRPKGVAIVVNAATPAGAAEGHLIGKADAPVQVVEFGDFECPHCGEFSLVTEPDIRAKLVNTGIISFRYYDFPLPGFKNSFTAHLAASCAEEQGKFWEMHDKLYASQDEWNAQATSDPLNVMSRYAGEMGLDVGAFRSCVTSQKPASKILGNHAEGIRRGVSGTPTIFAGKRRFYGVPYDQFKAIIDSTLADQKADSAVAARAGKRPQQP